ncbi:MULTISPECIES: hypothetical protein [Ensifer]|uniref:hypothetical protein n=1 Tax=Ensifer TaxID=106591 RepID=UPI00070CDE8B|nr:MULTISPECIES: hypothetical protein [Ensifer]KQW61083.1 hypothetical protein ASD02_23430 [Ensifer sp. Root1252]KQW71192.1 hypothetical protein ASD03_32645 [Ensifer sp. Root127]KQY73881.1 hypothetical protein ASD52_25910 [Ensifer sp. Root142]KRC77988.1 hypothetical protein ASE32_28040 [Ensifer sp. Root231]KRD00409.1 hypothetical protein ASE47_24000 [Ensifer sp. Root258]
MLTVDDDIKFTTGLTTAQGVRVAFRGTPFVERTAPLNQNALWMRWDRNMVVDAYSDMVEELSAIRTAVAMGDMSPLSKYVIAGPYDLGLGRLICQGPVKGGPQTATSLALRRNRPSGTMGSSF